MAFKMNQLSSVDSRLNGRLKADLATRCKKGSIFHFLAFEEVENLY